MYIGCSGSLMDRFETHVNALDEATKEWVSQVKGALGIVRMVILESQPTKQIGLEREKYWITVICPALNTVWTAKPILAPSVPVGKDLAEGARLYWSEDNRYFQSLQGAASFFGYGPSCFRQKIRKQGGLIFSPTFQREIQLEILDESLK